MHTILKYVFGIIESPISKTRRVFAFYLKNQTDYCFMQKQLAKSSFEIAPTF